MFDNTFSRFCDLVESAENALRKFHYKPEIIMFWYGVLTEAMIRLDFETGDELPEGTWETYDAICEMATRIVNEL